MCDPVLLRGRRRSLRDERAALLPRPRIDVSLLSSQNAERGVADVFNRVPVSLGDVADVALVQSLGPVPPVRAKHRASVKSLT